MKKSNLSLFLILATLAALVGLPVAALAAEAAPAPAAAAPWWLSVEFFSAALAFITSAIAVWQNKEKKAAQKVSETLVVAIEKASAIPAVAEKEKEIKEKIKEVTTKAGVEPIVNRLVRLLT